MLIALTRLLSEKTSLHLITYINSIVKFVTISTEERLCDLSEARFMIPEQT